MCFSKQAHFEVSREGLARLAPSSARFTASAAGRRAAHQWHEVRVRPSTPARSRHVATGGAKAAPRRTSAQPVERARPKSNRPGGAEEKPHWFLRCSRRRACFPFPSCTRNGIPILLAPTPIRRSRHAYGSQIVFSRPWGAHLECPL